MPLSFFRNARLVLPFLLAVVAAQTTPVERHMTYGETHKFPLQLAAGEFVYARIEQLSVDAVFELYHPGATDPEWGNLVGHRAYEHFSFIADTAGEYTVAVSSVQGRPAGRYRLHLTRRLTPTPADKAQAAAFRLVVADNAASPYSQNAAARAKSIATLDRAIELARTAADAPLEAYLHHRQSVWYSVARDAAKEREALERAIAIREKLPEFRSAWNHSQATLATALIKSGHVETALPILENCVEISRAEGDAATELYALNSLGLTASSRGDYEKAVEYYQRVLPLLDAAGMQPDRPVLLSNVAFSYTNMGDHQRAIDAHNEALKHWRAAKDDEGAARTLAALGRLMGGIGEREKAEDYLREATALAQKLGDKSALGLAASSVAEIKSRAGDHAGAAADLDRALAWFRDINAAANQVTVLASLSETYVNTGNWQKAREAALEALSISARLTVQQGLTNAHLTLAKVAINDRKPDDALSHFEQSIRFARENKSYEAEAKTLAVRAAYFRSSQRFHDALADLERAAAITESSAGRITSALTRAAYRASRGQRAKDHIDLLMDMQQRDPSASFALRAYNLTERARARVLAELLTTTAVAPRTLPPAEAKLLETVASVQSKLFRDNVPAAERRTLETSLAKAERELDLLQRVTPAGATAQQQQLSEFWDDKRVREEIAGPDGAVITYSLGPTRSFAFVLTREGFSYATLPPRRDIESRVESFRVALAKPVSGLVKNQTPPESGQLHQLLIAPLLPRLQGKRRLLFVTDGNLAYLPFEAIGATRPLLETYRIAYAPSASVAGSLRARPARPEGQLLAYGDPKLSSNVTQTSQERGFSFAALPNARAEVAMLNRLFPGSRAVIGADASEQHVKKEDLSTYRFLHFAAHGYFDSANPDRSGLVLASAAGEDGFLQSREIARLRMNAELVTLSSCQSGLGKVLDGEGVQGLARAFFLAGARNVVVSLWSVNDAATAELMRRFYTNLKNGTAPDEALRDAKLALLKTGWRQPHYWAPFVLQGN